MKSRHLHTTPVIIITNYTITLHTSRKYLHSFTPENTPTRYEFLANKEPLLIEGERYNIGYSVESGVNQVDTSAIAKAADVDPSVSHYFAKTIGQQLKDVETQKSDDRVVHNKSDGHYLGKKYAWRIYGMAVANETFYEYLKEINHPYTDCYTEGSKSIAYKNVGIEAAMDNFIKSCVKVGKLGNRFKSCLLPSKKWFTIKGLQAITDKK